MEGDDRVRFCSLCQQAVYDVSALSRAEAEALIEGTSERVCLRLFRRADGMVMTRDCPVGVLRAARRRLARAVGACTFAVLLLFGWVVSRPGAARAARAQVQAVEDWINPKPPCVMGGPMPMMGKPMPADDEEDDE
jgi:hypothetical protein